MIYSWFASLSHATSPGNLSLVVPTEASIRIKLMPLLSKLLIGRECNFSKFKQILDHPPRHLWDVLKLPGMVSNVCKGMWQNQSSFPATTLVHRTRLSSRNDKIALDMALRRHIIFCGLFTGAVTIFDYRGSNGAIVLNELTGKTVAGSSRREN
jgi:hypothetical protein